MKFLLKISLAIIFLLALTSIASAQACGGCTYGPSGCSQCHNDVVQGYWPVDDANTICLNCQTNPPQVKTDRSPHSRKFIKLTDGRTLEYIQPDPKRVQALNESGRYAKAVDNGSLMDLLAKSTGLRFAPTVSTAKFDHMKWASSQGADPECAKKLGAFVGVARQVAQARQVR